MKLGSLFTGYGGLDQAVADHFSADIAWVADNDPSACKVIETRMPGIQNLGDVTAVDWAAVPAVDIIVGGSPCQDVSLAGRRAGMVDGTRSNLWAAMREAIAVIQPQIVVWENVKGALSSAADSSMEQQPGRVGDSDKGPVLRALGRVLGDLADLGYDAEWCCIPASAAGAPHRRDRVFVTAWPSIPDASSGRS